MVGAVHDRLLTRGAGGGVGFAKKRHRIPNPGGRHGGTRHRAKVQQRAQGLENEGYTIVAGGRKHPERAVHDPNNGGDIAILTLSLKRMGRGTMKTLGAGTSVAILSNASAMLWMT